MRYLSRVILERAGHRGASTPEQAESLLRPRSGRCARCGRDAAAAWTTASRAPAHIIPRSVSFMSGYLDEDVKAAHVDPAIRFIQAVCCRSFPRKRHTLLDTAGTSG